MDVKTISNNIDGHKARNAVLVLILGVILGVWVSPFFFVPAIVIYVGLSLNAVDFKNGKK